MNIFIHFFIHWIYSFFSNFLNFFRDIQIFRDISLFTMFYQIYHFYYLVPFLVWLAPLTWRRCSFVKQYKQLIHQHHPFFNFNFSLKWKLSAFVVFQIQHGTWSTFSALLIYSYCEFYFTKVSVNSLSLSIRILFAIKINILKFFEHEKPKRNKINKNISNFFLF